LLDGEQEMAAAAALKALSLLKIMSANSKSPVKNPEMAQSVGWAAVGKYSDLQVFRVWGAVFLRMG
jgi:hypothetical protein